MKKTIIILTLLLLFSARASAFVHVVLKGESLESIADMYAIPKIVLIKANPGCDTQFYIGQRLEIPMAQEQPKSQPKSDKQDVTLQNPATKQFEKATDSHYENIAYHPKNNSHEFEKEISAGVSLNNFVGKECDGDKYKIGFHAGLTARYYFYSDYFIEGSLNFATKGFKNNKFESSGQYWDDEGSNYDSNLKQTYNTYNLDLPIMAGYRISIDNGLNVKIKAGPYLTYALFGKSTVKGYRTTYPDIHSSEKEHINESVKIGDMKDFHKFGYGVTTGISADFEQLVVSFTYQRAFSKTFGTLKNYEQNFLISLGYRF